MTTDAAPLPLPKRIVAAVAASVATVVVAHVANMLAFFVANGTQAAAIPQVNAYFLPASVVAAVMLAILFAIGAQRAWYMALPAGFLTALVAAVVGTCITIVQAGNQITGGVLEQVLASLGSVNLLYVIALTITTATLGLRVWRVVAGLPILAGHSAGRAGTAIVRLPAANLDEGQVTHAERVAVDGDRADSQWDAYLEALTDNGWGVVEAEPAPDLPGSVFVHDAVVVLGGVAVVARPAQASREPELDGVERTVRELGLRVERLTEPATLDGGDVLTVGTTLYVGRSGRTNAEAIRQLRALAVPLGYTVVAVPVTRAPHLSSVATALPDGTVVGNPALLDDAGLFGRFLAMPEPSGAQVVVLGHDTVLMAASAPRSAELVSELGYRVVTVDVSEFEKLEGGVACLSVLVR